ncbi:MULTISPECIES: isochorismatase family protein [unclassified Paenibacillus]|uniref:isochorismatase family protein n=1 Tax=unclassified Paenibacillus TaxID=185978 RepID=UPI001AE2B215|nr:MULTISPECIES: isochorismatase family protein [unclassified Paenibacillus]MBP1156421.1 nicotinamidase-related amidase [Paenibacillus sp. PvP091]MBP1168193.1 nicotinamidase-related amidase [Paenibacillus sp. PvR098]MBP2439221.1 nicotinamidase-related amidase [Paenibacillus sp. PvP052]
MTSKGWDRYLSDRDKQHDELCGKKELRGFGVKPALLLIDIYYSVLGTKREVIFESMRTWPGSTGLEGWEAVDRTAELLAVARENDIPVIHIKGLSSPIKPWIARTSRRGMSEELRGIGSQIVDEVKPLEGELVIEKSAPSAFQGTPLAYQLVSLGIDTVICCGETTSGCVRASVVDGATHRFKMGVVEECVFDRTESSHWINLYDMHQKYADVVNLADAVQYFKEIGAKNKRLVQS